MQAVEAAYTKHTSQNSCMEVQGVLRELQCKRWKDSGGETKWTVALGVGLGMGSSVLKKSPQIKVSLKIRTLISLTHNIMDMSSLGLAGSLPSVRDPGFSILVPHHAGRWPLSTWSNKAHPCTSTFYSYYLCILPLPWL